MNTLDRLTRALADRYRVERELGAGGMATVYLAHDLKHEREVAIKVLHPDLGAALGGERFLAEIKTTAKLQHPHILPLLDSGEADGLLYYVMPFVRGETLRVLLQREGALDLTRARMMLVELADALAHAHEQGIVHRDVKPENILLSSGHVLVADFGIAKAARSSGPLTGTGMSLGTPAYMAPEQAAGDPQTDHRADLYAWGIVAYEVMTGTVPFVGTPQQVMAAHFATPAPDVRSVRSDAPYELAELIGRCLQKEPSARPATAAEVVDIIAWPSRMISAQTEPQPSGAGAARRRSAVLAGTAALLAALAWATTDRLTTPDILTGTAAENRVAVMPLSAVSDSSLARLGEDLVVTLSTTLNGVGELRTVDPGTLLIKARSRGTPLPLADARALATDLGAGRVLTGALTKEGARIRATVTLTGVRDDSVLATASAVAAPTDVAPLTDSLTWAILRQVWQRGTPPSPVLGGLTTNSIEALRHFLDGEQAYQRLDYAAATAAYRRAFERDTLFAQAYLRYHLAMYWKLEPRDEKVWARLVSLGERLPEREREWLRTESAQLPMPAKIARWRALAAQYPDYPPAIMGAGDLILHHGGWYGLSLAESRPYFERLVSLNPDHLDARSHLQLAEWFSDDENVRRRAAGRLKEFVADSNASMWNNGFAAFAQAIDAASRGEPLELSANIRVTGRGMAALGSSAGASYYAGVFFGRLAPQRDLRNALDGLRTAGIYRGGIEEAVRFGEASSRAAQGEWRAAVDLAMPLASSTTVVAAMRLQPARLAAFGVYLGLLPSSASQRAFENVRQGSALEGIDAIELAFLEGVAALISGDSVGLRRSAIALAAGNDSISRHAARVLSGLERAQSTSGKGADSLLAVSESVIAGAPFLESAEALGRFAVARYLRATRRPGEVERYLRWIETFPLEARSMGSMFPLHPLVDYEWALALDAAGRPESAIRHYQSVVSNIDRPDPGLVAIVRTAAARLRAIDSAVKGSGR